jgi:hypothetical protein
LEGNYSARAHVREELSQPSGRIGLIHQNEAADYSIKRVVEAHLCRIAQEKRHVLQAIVRRPLAGNLQWRCDSIGAHNLACRSNEVGRNKGHVSYPASDIKDALAGINARLDE